MKSPVTGKKMILKKEKRTLVFRKEEFEVIYHFYFDPSTAEQFVDDRLETLNLTQVYNKYRERFNLPFREEIIDIRKKYVLSARRISDILGFGPNTYSNYEKGEIPNKANGRLIQLAKDPEEFAKLAELSGNMTPSLMKKIRDILKQEKEQSQNYLFRHLIRNNIPNRFTGYRTFRPGKAYQMILFFAETLQPWKTKLNKLLFYADFVNYKHTGYSISGLKYAAIDYGPVPNDYDILLTYGQGQDLFRISEEEITNEVSGERIIPTGKISFDNELFSDTEIEILKTIKKRFEKITTSEMVRISHEEPAWRKNLKKLIDYSYAFEMKV